MVIMDLTHIIFLHDVSPKHTKLFNQIHRTAKFKFALFSPYASSISITLGDLKGIRRPNFSFSTMRSSDNKSFYAWKGETVGSFLDF